MQKHFLLSHVATLSLSAMSAIQVMGQLPDTGTPMHFLIESDAAKSLDLLPTKNAKKFKAATLHDIIENTNVSGIKFVTTPDLKKLLTPDFLGEIGSAKNPDTAVYIGTMPAMTGDDDIGDNNLVVMAVGPQAKSLIETFSDLGEYKAMESTVVKQFFTALVTPKHIATKSGKSVGQPLKQMAEA